jgi:hypothetical protein
MIVSIGLAVSEPDRFTVEITRDRHFEQRFDRVVDLSGAFEDGFLDTIGELCQDDLSSRRRQLFEKIAPFLGYRSWMRNSRRSGLNHT